MHSPNPCPGGGTGWRLRLQLVCCGDRHPLWHPMHHHQLPPISSVIPSPPLSLSLAQNNPVRTALSQLRCSAARVGRSLWLIRLPNWRDFFCGNHRAPNRARVLSVVVGRCARRFRLASLTSQWGLSTEKHAECTWMWWLSGTKQSQSRRAMMKLLFIYFSCIFSFSCSEFAFHDNFVIIYIVRLQRLMLPQCSFQTSSKNTNKYFGAAT